MKRMGIAQGCENQDTSTSKVKRSTTWMPRDDQLARGLPGLPATAQHSAEAGAVNVAGGWAVQRRGSIVFTQCRCCNLSCQPRSLIFASQPRSTRSFSTIPPQLHSLSHAPIGNGNTDRI